MNAHTTLKHIKMAIGHTGFYEDGDSPGFQESADFVRDIEDEDASHLRPELRGLLEEDQVYAESAEAAEIEEQHFSRHLQNELPIGSDDDEEEEVNEMEILRDRIERNREVAMNAANNIRHDDINPDDVQPPTDDDFPLDLPVEDNPNHPLRVQQRNVIRNNEERLNRLFSENAANESQENELVTMNERSLSIADALMARILHLTRISHKYLGGKLDLETPDTIYFAISLKKFLEDIAEQSILIYEIFERQAYRYLNYFNILYSSSDLVLKILLEVETELQEMFESMTNIAKRLLEQLTNPRHNATINLALEMVNQETERLRQQNFNVEQIDMQIDLHAPYFLSEARLRLPYYTPLASSFSLEEIKCLTRFDLRYLVEIAVRLEIPRSYSLTRHSLKTGEPYRVRINADPTTQLFVMLARFSHGLTLKVLQIITKIDFRKLSAMQIALEHYLIQTKGQLLNCSKFKPTQSYRRFLSQNVPDTSTPECNLMEENVAFFIDGTGQKIAAPTKEDFTGSEYTYSGKDKMHCLRYQVVCDLFGFIWDVAGPYGGSVHDKRLYDESGLSNRLEQLVDHEDRPFVMYGDPAYRANDILTPQLIAAFKAQAGHPLTHLQKLTNQQYVYFRIIVERTFGMLANLFKGLILWFKNKIHLTDCSNSYKLACLFLNCYTIVYRTTNNKALREYLDDEDRNQTPPISLSDYLQYWIKDEYKATLSEDGTLVNNMNEDLDMRFILRGITEKELANIQRAQQREDAAATALAETNADQPQNP